MSDINRSFIIFILHVVLTHISRSQCASYYSYCLSGMQPDESNALICSNYVYAGYEEGCRYFKHSQNEWESDSDIYIHWSETWDKWYIGPDISSTDYYAYCYADALDDCTNGRWYFYSADTDETAINYDLTIEPCVYDNTECEANIGTSDFCVSHTFHRAVNKNIAGLYSISGCNEEQPYYNKYNDYALSWDNELDAWFLSYSHNVPASHHYAFCEETDIADCDQKWYIYNGDETELDTSVVSGYCDTCTDVSYDNVCVYFTESSSSSMQFIAGTYAFDQCFQLKSAYSKVNQNTLTLHYLAENNSFVIGDNYGSFSPYANCTNSTAITDCNGDASWFVRYQSSSEFVKESTMRIKVGACDDLYETNETDTIVLVIIICGAVIILAVVLLVGFFCYKHYQSKEVKTQEPKYSQVATSNVATDETPAPGQRTTPPQVQPVVMQKPAPCQPQPPYAQTLYSQPPQPLYAQTAYLQQPPPVYSQRPALPQEFEGVVTHR